MRKGSLHKDYSGQKFNKLTAIRRSDRQYPNGNYYWWFRCDCGNEKEILPSNVVKENNGVVSCGCVQKVKNHGKHLLNQLIWDYKIGAKKRGLDYSLTDEYFVSLIEQPCFYCGSPPSNVRTSDKHILTYNGIDRKNNKIGYTIDNCVPCCKICNFMKRDMSTSDFYSQVEKIYKSIVAAVA